MFFRTLTARSRSHLVNADEKYHDHLGFTLNMGLSLIVCAMRLMLHGLVPAWFEYGTSTRVAKLNATLQQRAATAQQHQAQKAA